MSLNEVVALALMLVGVLGIVYPVLPGLIIVLVGVLAWALTAGDALAWGFFAGAVVLYVAGVVLQALIPGRRMRRAGVRTSTLLWGLGFAVAGMFLIPVIGLFVGFPVGIFVVSLVRARDLTEARRATVHALKAVGLNILIELATAFVIIGAYLLVVLFIHG